MHLIVMTIGCAQLLLTGHAHAGMQPGTMSRQQQAACQHVLLPYLSMR